MAFKGVKYFNDKIRAARFSINIFICSRKYTVKSKNLYKSLQIHNLKYALFIFCLKYCKYHTNNIKGGSENFVSYIFVGSFGKIHILTVYVTCIHLSNSFFHCPKQISISLMHQEFRVIYSNYQKYCIL